MMNLTELLHEKQNIDKLEDIVQQIPLGRMATARDVAKSTLFLASDDADYINGQVITVDGGWI